MKSIFDKSFKYNPSFDTDVKKTISRIRKQQDEERKQVEENKREAEIKVKTISARRS